MPNVTNYITIYDDGTFLTSNDCPCEGGGSNPNPPTSTPDLFKTIDSNCVGAETKLHASLWNTNDVNTLGHINRTGYGGVLIADQPTKTIDLVLPYMVVIGDSISEGHPNLHGRLHTSNSNTYDLSHASQAGQISYDLAQNLNIPIINQGIGGQTTQQVRNRWDRDVLAIDTSVGDGRGTRTLEFGGQKPTAVYLHCGINDIFQNTPDQTIKDNFTFFAQSCLSNNIDLIVANIGAHASYDTIKEFKATTINDWLSGDFKTNNPEVTIIDYLKWSTDNTNNYTTLKTGCFADSVHPNAQGYSEYSQFITNNVNLPLNISKLKIGYKLQLGVEPTKFDRISQFTFNSESYNITGVEEDEININQLLNKDNPIYTIDVTGVQPVTTSSGNRYTGVAVLKTTLTN